MCGIAGLIFEGNEKGIGEAGALMVNALLHRGPDDQGAVRPPKSPQVFLGHRRLSILDLSKAGHQPMAAEEGRYWIVFNGEIYNYRELKKELEAQGVSFRSGSDTEVLLALFVREKEKCLRKLRGMFAFAIWDDEKKELFMARDLFGIKPLYFVRDDLKMIFGFASELKALYLSACFPLKINSEAEVSFLERGSISAPKTFYKEFTALEPGHYAVYKNGELSIRSYGSFEELCIKPETKKTIEQTADDIRKALIESVQAHMVSDVPVGVFLSGGVDSAALVAAVREFYTGPLQTFTLVFPGTRWDEGEAARKTAKYFQTEHIEVEVTFRDFDEALEDFFKSMDQPTLDGMNTYFVAKMARKAGIKVALSGLGGDEILGGYESFKAVPRLYDFLNALQKIPGLVSLLRFLTRMLPFSWIPKLSQILESRFDHFESLWKNYRAVFTKEQILKLGYNRPIRNQESGIDAVSQDSSHFEKVSLLEIQHFLIPQLLRDSDVFTMAHGLEVRTPFVDSVFVQAVSHAGLWEKGRARSYKSALFAAMKGFLPPHLLNQKKKGFVLPFENWLKNIPKCQDVLSKFKKDRMHWSRLWAMIVLEEFKKRIPHE